jgi:hypothetical protein
MGIVFLEVLVRRCHGFVPISSRTVDALRAHWRDWHLYFDEAGATIPLLVPAVFLALTRRRVDMKSVMTVASM